MRSSFLLIAFAACLVVPHTAFAWGDRGHSIVAEIAQRHLNAKAVSVVTNILGSSSLASVASWADDYKNTTAGAATKPWHYVDVDVAKDTYTEMDCGDAGCLVSALRKLSSDLPRVDLDEATRRNDLLLLIHLVGDSTQPLHCGEKNKDGGGNSIKVSMELAGPDHKPLPTGVVTLHAIWDDFLIGAAEWSWGGYAARLDQSVVPTISPPDVSGDFSVAWINECHAATRAIYALTPAAVSDGKVQIDPTYQAATHDILDKQLATGGVRLAALLNALLGT